MRKSVFHLVCGLAIAAVITLTLAFSLKPIGWSINLVNAQTDQMGLQGSPIAFTLPLTFMSPKAVGRDGFGLPEGVNLNNIVPGTADTVSQASYFGGQIALSSYVSGFGEGLSNVVAIAAAPGQPNLGGVTINCTDWFGLTKQALISYVHPNQINFKMPDELGLGPAQCIYTNTHSGQNFISNFELVPVRPGIFTANASGGGIPASTVARVRNGVTQYFSPYRFESCTLVPIAIDLGPATDTIYVGMITTGIRFRSLVPPPTVRVGGVDCQVTFAAFDPGSGSEFIQFRLDRSLAGHGYVNVETTVDGVSANNVKLLIQ